jgi:hypothetical protein
VELCEHLKTQGIGSCGTVKPKRVRNPAVLKLFHNKTAKRRLQELSPSYRSNDNGVLAVAWFDKRAVCLLSTVHRSGEVNKRMRDRHGAGGFREIAKPIAVDGYNSKMGGVDRSDQLNSYYLANGKTVKWWKKVLFHMLNTAITNAFVLFRSVTSHPKKDAHREFRLSLADTLGFQTGPRSPASTVPVAVRRDDAADLRLNERHFPEKIAGGSNPDCIVCSDRSKKRRKQCTFKCKNCPGEKAMCIIPCFELYHSYKDHRRHNNDNYTD